MQTLLNRNLGPLAVLDPKGNFSWVNMPYALLWGRPAQEFAGRSVFDFCPDSETKKILKEVLRSGKPCTAAARPLKLSALKSPGDAHSETTYWDWVVVPQPDNEGRIELICLSLHDVTERQRLKRELEQQRARLEGALDERVRALGEAAERKDLFLNLFAHELRNPLSAISAASALLARMDLPEEASMVQEALERQTKWLGQRIDDLLEVSRVLKGNVSLDRVMTDVRAVVDAALQSVRSEIEAHSHRYVVSYPEDPMLMSGDAAKLQQVFTHLLLNAIRYMPDGGLISIGLWRTGDSALIKIDDNGVGIPPEHRAKVFEPFFRIDAASYRGGQSLGIGLTLAKHLVELHGGAVSLSGAAGSGTSVSVSLPLWKSMIAELIEPVRKAPLTLEVLIVDDHRDTAVLTAALLDGEGHTTAVAFDGESALQVALSRMPDVILLDIGMPECDGFEVARRLRAAGFEAPLIVAVSGYDQEGDRALSRSAGFDWHLSKPLDYTKLAPLLVRWNESARAEAVRAARARQMRKDNRS